VSADSIPCCALLPNGERCPLPVHHDPAHNAAREPEPRDRNTP
jgi:hypothetical protein